MISMFESFQSAFRAQHSTQTALLKVMNDAERLSILVFLDLSTVFDTADHTILLSHLEKWVGISGTVSYLTDRTFCVGIIESRSSTSRMDCGVPQGSVLGPILFTIYMLPL